MCKYLILLVLFCSIWYSAAWGYLKVISQLGYRIVLYEVEYGLKLFEHGVKHLKIVPQNV